jgi:DNA-binding response OmpR family regulator
MASVLIIDDSLTVRMDLAQLFTAEGFTVRQASTATEGRETLAAAPADLVILDVVLPDGDGVEVLRDLRATEHGKRAVIIMLSSEAEVRDRIRALQTGAEAYVAKPCDRTFLVAKTRELLRSRGDDEDTAKPLVLVVDDSPTFRARVVAGLKREGYRTSEAGNGEDGLRRAAELRPDAIIVDGVMPGIDGPTVIRHVRLDLALRHTPCVLLTGSDEKGDEVRALDAGADAYVLKSADLEVVLARLAAAMRMADRQKSRDASLLGPHTVLAVCEAELGAPLLESLRVEGLNVTVAHNGSQAIELLNVDQIDCVILGFTNAGDQLATCRRIRSAPLVRDLPIIAFAPSEERALFLDLLGAGADDVIVAGTDPAIARARVRSQLRRKQVADEIRRVRDEKIVAEELERQNRELDAFSYSVAHDLRAPLRSISGFSAALVEDYAPQLDDRAKDYLQRVQTSARRMGELIDDLLQLAKVGRAELRKQPVDLAGMARSTVKQLRDRDPSRGVELVVAEKIVVEADRGLLQVLLDNLLSNAWKFTSKRADARIEVGIANVDGVPAYFVRDNGAGFEPSHAARLFRPFQRLHSSTDFEGTGIGLATVQRVVTRHGGRVWAEGAIGSGATFFFTLGRGA